MSGFYRKMIVFVIPVLLIIAFIFSNSLKNSEESNKDSGVIVEVVEEIAEQIAPNNQLNWNYIVRKSAHLFEFFVLGVCAILFFFQLKLKAKFGILYVFTFVILIASADEFIQRFTGRTSCWEDVVIDVCGASIGIVFVLLLSLLKKRIEQKKKTTNPLLDKK